MKIVQNHHTSLGAIQYFRENAALKFSTPLFTLSSTSKCWGIWFIKAAFMWYILHQRCNSNKILAKKQFFSRQQKVIEFITNILKLLKKKIKIITQQVNKNSLPKNVIKL